MPPHKPRFPKSRRLDVEASRPRTSGANGKPPRHETRAERAVRLETRALEQRLLELEASQRDARRAIEEQLRREHWGHLPEGWHEHTED